MKRFAMAVEICKDDRRASGKLPNDLAASATRRRQRFRVSNNCQISKLSLALRQSFPDCDAFGTDCQTITRTLDVASGVNLATRSSHCRTNTKIRKGRD